MSRVRIAITAALLLLSGLVSAASQNQCLTTTPHRPIDEATMAGMKRYEAFKANQSSARGVKSFLDAVFSYGVSLKVDEQIQNKTSAATKHLQWSGHKGGLIEILMQRSIGSDIPAELLAVSFLGGGECPFNVLSEQLSKDQLGAGPRDGFKVDNDASFFVWVSIDKTGKTKVTTVAPGSRGLIVEKVIGDKAAASVLASTSNAREIDQLRALVRQIDRVETSEKVKKEVQDSMKKREDAKVAINNVDKSLQRALKEQESAANAMAWVDSLDKVLTFAKLVVQVQSLVSDAPKTTLDAIKKANNKEELKKALEGYQGMALDSVTFYQNDKKVLLERLTLYRKTITDTATKNGAPKSAVELPLQP